MLFLNFSNLPLKHETIIPTKYSSYYSFMIEVNAEFRPGTD